MNKRKLLVILSTVLSLLIISAVVVYAAAYNSESDPLVALSYLTNVFKPSIDSQITSVSNRVTAAENKLSQLENSIGNGSFDTTEIDGRLDELENMDEAHSQELSSIKSQLSEAKAALEELKLSLEAISSEAATKADVSSMTERLEGVSSELDGQNERIEELVSTYESLMAMLINERVPSENNYGYVTVMLDAGERVVCEGKCSMMLRGGSGIYTFSADGYDSTAMTEIASGSTAEAEHIVVFENGAQFTASESSAIMIKGEYTVE